MGHVRLFPPLSLVRSTKKLVSGLLAANYSQAYPVDKQAINGDDTVQLFANSGRRSLAVIPFSDSVYIPLPTDTEDNSIPW